MRRPPARTIRIAAALIDDGHGRLLLVRKRGTRWFMQAGGKIEGEEDVRSALMRELSEEIGLGLEAGAGHYLGCFTAPAANEADCTVEAELFHIRSLHRPLLGAEIEEAIWVLPAEAELLSLAPLTRECVMPLARML